MNSKPIRILIVEDEILLLKNIKKKIQSAGSFFTVAGESTNGREAWDMIRMLRPDVVFTDIRMPIMDGLTLSGMINETYPEIRTVIISGYDDFEYARTALSNRVYDYLLKPVKIEELKKLLDRLYKEICEKRNAFMHKVLTDELNGLAPASETLSDDVKNRFSCFLVCFGNLHTHSHPTEGAHSVRENTKQIPWNSVMNSITDPPSDYWVFPQQFDNITLIVMESDGSPCDQAAQDIYYYLRNCFPALPVNVCYASDSISFSELHRERIRLRRHLFSSLVIGQSALLNAAGKAEAIPPAVLSSSTVQYLQSLLQSSNLSAFALTFRQLFEEYCEKQYPQQWIEKILLQIFTIFQQHFYFSEEDYEQMTHSVFTSLEMADDYHEAVEEIILELQRWITLNQSVPTEINTVVEEMNEYILHHYREALNISELAQKYHFNQSYLTRVFKKQKGQSPLKLINELRIHDAANLLQDPALSVREISEILGFTDQHYFSRIFKDFTGLSPKEFRAQKE